MGTDIFTIQGRSYLITLDYFSHFFELDYLPETTAETVITKLKHHFARHGIPDTVVSDNGPQYSSQQFRLFTCSWGFRHVTSSPGHSQSNGAAEAAVKVAKNMMKKCLHAKEDPYLGLLNLRNTQEEGMTSSPAQRIMGRRTKTALPTTFKLLQPTAGDFIKQEKNLLENKRQATAEYHNHRKDLRPLTSGEIIKYKRSTNRNNPGKVV